MKQTAVEWLVEELSDVLGPMDTNSIRDLLLMDAINRAKEMEKYAAQQYAEFAIECYRKELPVLEFDGWINLRH
jgi:hypothetical protein